jgi:hypothetical protein
LRKHILEADHTMVATTNITGVEDFRTILTETHQTLSNIFKTYHKSKKYGAANKHMFGREIVSESYHS